MSAEREIAVNDEVEVVVEKLVAGGDGLARVDGLPLFIARSAPGDRLRVRVWQRKSGYGRAEIVEVLEPGPDRREPPCPVFDRCGGCDLQQLEDAAQVRHKVAATRETLERLGGVEWPAEVRVVSGAAWGYRLRARLHTAAGEAGVEVGYRERSSHRLVPIDGCPVLVTPLDELVGDLPAVLASADPLPERLDLAAGDERQVTLSPPVAGLPRGEVSLRLGGYDYDFDARCFFQAHAELTAQLAEEVVGEWSGETACDLYAGVGLFALPLAARYTRVTAVEGDTVAARYQRRNVRRNGVRNLEVENRAVESWVNELPPGIDRVVVDPPRAGLGVSVLGALIGRPPRRLTYVSCHPAALARDLRTLARKYTLERLTLLDLFPQTGHIEVVAQLAATPEEPAAAS